PPPPPGAGAAGTLDQSQEAQTDSAGAFLVGGMVFWQTFTAGRSGALDQVDLLLNREGSPGTLTVEVHATTAGQPASDVLGSGTLPDTALDLDPSTYEWASVVLSQPFA